MVLSLLSPSPPKQPRQEPGRDRDGDRVRVGDGVEHEEDPEWGTKTSSQDTSQEGCRAERRAVHVRPIINLPPAKLLAGVFEQHFRRG